MPSRWLRWEPSTHIFEYSTDFAASWNPLPLNASILTEGVISAARLPPGLPSNAGDNIWTGTNIFQGVAPGLIFNETDQGADLKRSSLYIDGGILRYVTTTDIGALLAERFTVKRDGAITSTASSESTFNINIVGPGGINIVNANADQNSYAFLNLHNNAGPRAYIRAYHSTNPSAADRVDFGANGVGGAALVANAGNIQFYVQNGFKLTLTTTDAKFAGTITSKGRAFADGVWQTVPWAAGNFTASTGAWTVDSADQIHVRYTYLSGNSMLVSFDIRASSVSAVTSYLYLKVPDGKSSLGSSNGGGVGSNNGAVVPIGVFGLAGPVIYITPGPVGTTWAISANNTSVGGSIILDVN